MTDETRLAALDARFIELYEATRRCLLGAQKARALLLVTEDSLYFYHGGRAPEVLGGLRPPLYEKLKTVGHVPLAIYCLLCGEVENGAELRSPIRAALRDYRALLASAAPGLDT